MKKILYFAAVLAAILVTAFGVYYEAQAATTAAKVNVGGTGLNAVKPTFILFGGTTATANLATSSGLFFTPTPGRLNFTFGSTTALSATTLCLSTDCRTVWPSSGGGGSGSVSTSTHEVANQIAVFSSNSATPATIAGNSAFTFDGTANRLTVTYASTTAITASKFFGALVGNADTATLATAATALAANGTNCSAGNYALGVDASGNAEGCTTANLGTLTSIAVASANGLAGSSSGGATPTLTLTTTVTGVVKANGTAFSAAANGTDFTLITANTCGAGQFFNQTTAAGVFTCGTPSASGAAYPFTPGTFGTLSVSATTTAIQAYAGLISATSTIGAINATSSLKIANLSGILKATAGVVSTATGDTDFQNPIALTTSGTSGAATFIGDTLNIPQYSGGAGGQSPFSWTVTAKGTGDFTTIQAALNKCGTAGGGSILLLDSVLNDGTTALQFKGSNCQIYGASGVGTTTINFTGATTLFNSDTAAGYTHNGLHGLLLQGDGNTSSIAINWANQTHGDVGPIETGGVGTSLALNATTDTTFYNNFHDLDFNDNRAFCINGSSTNAVNGNRFDNIFCGAPAGGGTGINLNNENGNSFNLIYLEPASVTGTIGLSIFDNKMTNNGGVWNNTFSNFYDEANGTGVKIAVSSPGANGNGIQRNTFSNFINESNTTDFNIGTVAIAQNTFINAMDSNFSDPINTFQQPFGIGTSTRLQNIANTPYAALAVSAINASSIKEFVVANSTNREDFSVNNSGVATFGAAPVFSAITSCATTQALTTTSTGLVQCGTISGSGGAAFPFTPGTNYGAAEVATSTAVFFSNGIMASTTKNYFAALTIDTATNQAAAFQIRNSAGTSVFDGDTNGSTYGFGVGTTSPWASLSVVGDGTNPAFSVSTSTSNNVLPNFMIDKVGHVVYSGPKPTCTTNCTIVAGNDNAFRIKTGSAVTTETVTFSSSWGTLAPICTATNGDAGTSVVSASTTPTTILLSNGSLTSKDIDVICHGIQ